MGNILNVRRALTGIFLLAASLAFADPTPKTVPALNSLVWIQSNQFEDWDCGIGTLPGSPWGVNFNVGYTGYDYCHGSDVSLEWDEIFATLIDPQQNQNYPMVGSASGPAGTYFQMRVKAWRGNGHEIIEVSGIGVRRDRIVNWANDWTWEARAY